MTECTYNMPTSAHIHRLSDGAANRIAAGEVVERPASAVKELVENAIDAGALRVEVTIADGGRSLIRVSDDGHGIAADELALSLERHATSKLDGEDLVNIRWFGFRGEALPSIASVSRLTLLSRQRGADAWEISAMAGEIGAPRPAARALGTTVEIRDLFHATPARLKFLRTARAETQAVTDMIRRLALARPDLGFILLDRSGEKERTLFRADRETGDLTEARLARAGQVLGREFPSNAITINAERDEMTLTGHVGVPAFSKGAAVAQHVFVNGRPVRDRVLLGAIRAAYSDVLARERYPVTCLFLDCPPDRVDVNVHPAKAEVRFREPGKVRGFVLSAIRHALAEAGIRQSTTISAAALGAFQPGAGSYRQARPSAHAVEMAMAAQAPMEGSLDAGFAEHQPVSGFWLPEHGPSATSRHAGPSSAASPADEAEEESKAHLPLGHAKAQLHSTYIVAETAEGMILVDQHAAHERLVYERLKRQMADSGVARQGLLIPEIVELGTDADRVLEVAEQLATLGLVIEPFGAGTIIVREIPALLGQPDVAGLLRDVADEITDLGSTTSLGRHIDAILSRISCHGSVRAGRKLTQPEMDALLREMEATPNANTCNHGRPTWIALDRAGIEKLFGRR